MLPNLVLFESNSINLNKFPLATSIMCVCVCVLDTWSPKRK